MLERNKLSPLITYPLTRTSDRNLQTGNPIFYDLHTMTSSKTLCTLTTLALSSMPCFGDVRIGSHWQYFDYEETSSQNVTLNREDGGLPGVFLRAQTQLGFAWLEAGTSYAKGDVDYKGLTQGGRSLETTTTQRLIDYRLRAGVPFALQQSTLTPYLVTGYQRWDRAIHPTASTLGLDEFYRWWEAGAGARWCGGFGYGEVCALGEVFGTVEGTVEVGLEPVGLGRPELDLGEGTGVRLELDWSPALAPHLSLGWFYERWDHGESNTVFVQRSGTVFGVSEPDSETVRQGLRLAIRF